MKMFEMPTGAENLDKNNEQTKKVDYSASNVKVSEAEMEELVDKFLKRPENENIKITRKTARMAVQAELDWAGKKIENMYIRGKENNDHRLAA